MDMRVRRVIMSMEERLCHDVPLGKLAESLNISESRLRHLFKASTGSSPKEYLQSLRLRRAEELLCTTFLSIKEIRISVGIVDGSNFIRHFKKVYGTTPLEYRLMRRETRDGDHPGPGDGAASAV
ncbi:MAG: helix-turn-helix domain-containing protein [Pyrinomonadaceae bacterium]